jgi:hypothetical protein
MGDFNKDVYNGVLSVRISSETLRLCKLCLRTTGQPLPQTHNCGRLPINAIFGTVGMDSTATTLLLFGASVGDHQVFIIDLSSQSIISDAFPRVLPAAGRLLNCNSDCICCKYNWVLNQLANRHLLFHKLLCIGHGLDALTNVQIFVRLSKVDKELKDFMTATEKDCHKYLGGHIEWCPETGVWTKHRWLLGQVQVFLNTVPSMG